MIKVIFASLLLATALILAHQPAKAEWLCGVDRCVWVSYDVDEPAFALLWGPPMRPSCFWRRGILGRWRMICPR